MRLPDFFTTAAVPLIAAALLAGALLVGARVVRAVRPRRRAALPTGAAPPGWWPIVVRNFRLAQRLSLEERDALLQLVQTFIGDKHFEGCGGLVVTEEMRVAIAAQACFLILHHEGPCYPSVRTILIYPSSVVPRDFAWVQGEPRERLPVIGQASRALGTVILSWDHVGGSAVQLGDGENVVLHEFAHQLDAEDGAADGVPLLDSPSAIRSWARVLKRDFDELRRDVDAGRPTVLSAYGATNEAEFFAVATESFFGKPAQLAHRHPQLFDELKRYYRQDPRRLAALPAGGP